MKICRAWRILRPAPQMEVNPLPQPTHLGRHCAVPLGLVPRPAHRGARWRGAEHLRTASEVLVGDAGTGLQTKIAPWPQERRPVDQAEPTMGLDASRTTLAA